MRDAGSSDLDELMKQFTLARKTGTIVFISRWHNEVRSYVATTRRQPRRKITEG
jgi:hypothetical protein